MGDDVAGKHQLSKVNYFPSGVVLLHILSVSVRFRDHDVAFAAAAILRRYAGVNKRRHALIENACGTVLLRF